MQLEGQLDHGRLVDLLYRLSSEVKTGILTVQGEHDIIAVTFLKGRIMAADALNESMEEGLGQVLANQGLVSPEKFQEVLESQQSSGSRVAELLVARRLIGREQLLQAVRLQTYRLLIQLLRWHQGEFNLFLGDEISYEDGIKPISVEELLIRSIGDLGSEGPLTGQAPDLGLVFEKVFGDEREICVLGRDGEEPDGDAKKVWLTKNEGALLERIDGERPGSFLISDTGLEDYAVQYGIYRLLTLKLLRRGRPPGAEPLAPSAGFDSRTPMFSGPPPGKAVDRPVDRPPERPSPAASADVSNELVLPDEAFEVPELPTIRPEPAFEESAEEELENEEIQPRRVREPVDIVASVWFSRLLSLGLIVLLIWLVGVRSHRSSILFPYPWQESRKIEFESSQRSAIYYRIDRAIRTYYLLYGRFPESLGILADLELLSRADLRDSLGRLLDYSVAGQTYTLQPTEGGVRVPGTERTAEVSSDFLLNAQLVDLKRLSTRPVYLLD